ncbi:Os04g0116700 [Oryza sativa Japonica Group]|uniref:Os04g0116700 protein n=1 Tax=Oryza sativa subsp. japonica TaxID=39947 RepID=A0A0P0W636_ORYSJ|nr:Os04g0116700 [Oryza sativa Japonica Group]
MFVRLPDSQPTAALGPPLSSGPTFACSSLRALRQFLGHRHGRPHLAPRQEPCTDAQATVGVDPRLLLAESLALVLRPPPLGLPPPLPMDHLSWTSHRNLGHRRPK